MGSEMCIRDRKKRVVVVVLLTGRRRRYFHKRRVTGHVLQKWTKLKLFQIFDGGNKCVVLSNLYYNIRVIFRLNVNMKDPNKMLKIYFF